MMPRKLIVLIVMCVLVHSQFSVAPAAGSYFDEYFDQYGQISWRDEKSRLLNFEIFLLRNSEMIGYIGFHWSDNTDFEEMRRRAIRARTYLLKRGKLDKGRVVIVSGKKYDNLTILQPLNRSAARPKF